jgi:hypothetical protein
LYILQFDAAVDEESFFNHGTKYQNYGTEFGTNIYIWHFDTQAMTFINALLMFEQGGNNSIPLTEYPPPEPVLNQFTASIPTI